MGPQPTLMMSVSNGLVRDIYASGQLEAVLMLFLLVIIPVDGLRTFDSHVQLS